MKRIGRIGAVTLLFFLVSFPDRATASRPETMEGSSSASAPSSSRWMPDVAPRLDELRERQLRFDREAGSRRALALRSGQWWRGLALRDRKEAAR